MIPTPPSTEFSSRFIPYPSTSMTSIHAFMHIMVVHHYLSSCYTEHSKTQRNFRMAENVEITTESASPLEKDFVLKKIKEYENFVKLKLEPKIQDLEKSKVE